MVCSTLQCSTIPHSTRTWYRSRLCATCTLVGLSGTAIRMTVIVMMATCSKTMTMARRCSVVQISGGWVHWWLDQSVIQWINESVINESVINESVINESVINESVINESVINESINQNQSIRINQSINHIFTVAQHRNSKPTFEEQIAEVACIGDNKSVANNAHVANEGQNGQPHAWLIIDWLIDRFFPPISVAMCATGRRFHHSNLLASILMSIKLRTNAMNGARENEEANIWGYINRYINRQSINLWINNQSIINQSIAQSLHRSINLQIND